ncbi:unnamed protein product [Mortierella alpina]
MKPDLVRCIAATELLILVRLNVEFVIMGDVATVQPDLDRCNAVAELVILVQLNVESKILTDLEVLSGTIVQP